MNFLMTLLKILLMLFAVLLIAAPIIIEYFNRCGDGDKKISYKRFRFVVFTVVYAIVITIVFYLAKELILWFESLSFIKWLGSKIAVNGRLAYFVKVYAVILLNFGIGLVFQLLIRFVQIGLRKKNLVKPGKKDGTFTLRQRAERAVIRFFHNETWYLVGRILKWFNISVSVLYALIFILYQIPALFGAAFIPFEFISMLFSASYIYPTITLLVLWETYFFLAGIEVAEEECPELFAPETSHGTATTADLAMIDSTSKSNFKDFFVKDVPVEGSTPDDEVSTTDYHELTKLIGESVEKDKRNPQQVKELYLRCLDRMVAGDDSLVINGSLFSEFSMYFLRYLSVILARGDNVIFVCNSDDQIDAVHDHLKEGLSEIASLYSEEFAGKDDSCDDPVWRMVKISGERHSIYENFIDDTSILITTLDFLCSTDFEDDRIEFLHLLDTVVFVDSLETVNRFPGQLAMFNTRLCHLSKSNALKATNSSTNNGFKVRYNYKDIRYFCFDDTRTPGLDRVLKNILSVEMESVDAMIYSENTMLRCYNYEGTPSGDETSVLVPRFINAEEVVGSAMSLAILGVQLGAGNAAFFADKDVPFANFAETIAANGGQLTVPVTPKNLGVNRYFYNPDGYSVVVAVDRDNLPATLRRYAGMVSDKPTLVMVVSRQYMLRDYYLSCIEDIWKGKQIMRIPVEAGTKLDIARRILVKSNAGGITEDEIIDLVSGVGEFEALAKERDINGILREILDMYGVEQENKLELFRYFEYETSRDFDENGEYHPVDKVVLRRQGTLYEMVSGRDMAVLSVNSLDYVLPIPRNRITQNYIVGQNVVHNGNIYNITGIDTAAGKIYAKHAPSGMNSETREYIQERKYRVELDPDKVTDVYAPSQVLYGEKDGEVSVSDVTVSVFRAPMEVLTPGYFIVDPGEMNKNSGSLHYENLVVNGNETRAKQTYRRYGDFSREDITYIPDSVVRETHLAAYPKGAVMMSVRLKGQFGKDANRTLAVTSVLVGEILHAMFPTVADSVAVCPVFRDEFNPDEVSADVLRRIPDLTILGGEQPADEGIEFLIIEDCAADLGVIAILKAAGNDMMSTIFSPVLQYLNWYMDPDKPKTPYLNFGHEVLPECFDLESAHSLARILGIEEAHHEMTEIKPLVEYDVCDFCGKRYPKGSGDVHELDDGRKMCRDCGRQIIGNKRRELNAYLEEARRYLESTYGITLGDDYKFCFESTVKITNTLKKNSGFKRRGTDAPIFSYIDEDKNVHVEYDIPPVNLGELLVRELTHVWQRHHLPDLPEDLAEGHIALVSVQYLRFKSERALANIRANYYETTENISGVGYRRLMRELLENPQYRNNPFRYLMEIYVSGDGSGGGEDPAEHFRKKPPVLPEGEYGAPYTPASPDRCDPANIRYFYYDRITGEKRALYERILSAVRNFEPQVDVGGADIETIKDMIYAVQFDHPELFYFNFIFSVVGNMGQIDYGATREEAAQIQAQIDQVVPDYLAGIDDSMSAYDVAIRLHARLIGEVDYDGIALRQEQARGTPNRGEIDYLRQIPGVFLRKTAVCEGYARAMQYLLQKCGIECAEAAGYVIQENGSRDGGHAWNILKLDGDYYYLDVTWDDRSNTIQEVKDTNMGMGYFCITTEELCRSRETEELSPFTPMPVCNATKCNYYVHNGLVIDTYDLKQLEEIAAVSAKSGGSVFTFKCSSSRVFEEAKEKLWGRSRDWDTLMKAYSKASGDRKKYSGNEYSLDPRMRIITIYFTEK